MSGSDLLSLGSSVLGPGGGGLSASSSAKSDAASYNSQTVTTDAKSGDFTVTTGGGITAGGNSWALYAAIAGAVLLGFKWISRK